MQKQATKTERQRNGNGVGRQKSKDVVFTLDQPEAETVFLCGDFNEWSPRSLRMFRRADQGQWKKHLPLPPGRYEYKFVVDGEWIHDAKAEENKPNVHGSINSVLEGPHDVGSD